MADTDILEHYHSFCVSGVWFDKIERKQLHGLEITRHDIMGDLLAERDRILSSVQVQNKRELRKSLNAIAAKYISKMRYWATREALVEMA